MVRRRLAAGAGSVALLVTALAAASAPSGDPAPPNSTMETIAARIMGAALVSGRDYAVLSHLTDRIGPRLSGSAGAEEAVRWTAERLREDGLEVRLEPVTVPHWVRGEETAEILGGPPQALVVTALGGSVPTPAEGIAAEVVVVDGLEGLDRASDAQVRGRIVLLNRAMVAGSATDGYGVVVAQRSRGAAAAARKGAVAVLVRSVGTLSARLPHTGGMSTEDGVPPIPAAAVTAEDADLLARRAASGAPVRVRLRLGCRTLPDAPSANVVADLRGRERPEEIVVIGAHLDSWDLGTGAHDDGAGVAMVMESLRLLKSLGLVPRRTVRGVLFMNEENGLRGGRAYAKDHAHELARHVAAIESDSGGFAPEGFTSNVDEPGLARLRGLAALLRPLGATRITAGGGGADIGPMRPFGVPLLGLDVDGARYFDWHHTPADTLDKVDPRDLARCTAAMAVMAYALAELDPPLPRPSPSPSPSSSPAVP